MIGPPQALTQTSTKQYRGSRRPGEIDPTLTSKSFLQGAELSVPQPASSQGANFFPMG